MTIHIPRPYLKAFGVVFTSLAAPVGVHLLTDGGHDAPPGRNPADPGRLALPEPRRESSGVSGHHPEPPQVRPSATHPTARSAPRFCELCADGDGLSGVSGPFASPQGSQQLGPPAGRGPGGLPANP